MQLSNSKEFNEAVHNLDHLKSVDNPTKLRLYALYKQATVGKNEKKKPGFTDIVGRVKFWQVLCLLTPKLCIVF